MNLLPELYAVPMPDWLTYETLRYQNEQAGQPDAVLPLPGEPVVHGDMPGTLKVWASTGTEQGWYQTGDVFTPVV